MKAVGSRSLALGLIGLVLAVALVLLARPARIVALVGTARLPGVAVALLWACGVLLARSVRLAVLLAPNLPVVRAAAVVSVSQCAASVLPLRLGELALPPLLEVAGVPGLVRGLAYAVLVRLLDVAALVIWTTVAVLALGTPASAGAILALMLVAVTVAVISGQRLLPPLVRRWRVAGRLRRASARQLLQVRREIRLLRRSPTRALLALATSVAVWGGLWGLTATLLTAMGRHWPAPAVLASVVGAAVGSSLPINAVGSFGSLEAGWTAAAAAFGIPAGQALADGFATHLWSLAFSLLFAVPGLVFLALSHPGSTLSRVRATLTQRRRNSGGP